MFDESWSDPEAYWEGEFKKHIVWMKKGSKIYDCDMKNGKIKWFTGYETNYCWNALDRHIEAGNGDDIALIWEGNDPSNIKRFSYQEMHEHVCQYANLLKKLGVTKGDRVCIYLPMRPQMIMAILACARLGAIFVTVFSALSAEALQTRIEQSGSSILITCDEGISGIKHDPIKEKANVALSGCPNVRHTIVHHFTGLDYESHPTDLNFEKEIASMPKECDYTLVEANEPFFIIYSSGSSGVPKGIVHTIAYCVWAAMGPDIYHNTDTGDVVWCCGNPAWIGGIAYAVLGPFLLRITTLMYEGDFFYPSPGRVFEILERHSVASFMTQPTYYRLIRALGPKYVSSCDLTHLRTVITAGEVCSPDLWQWIHKTVCRDGESELIHIYGQSEGCFLGHHREISGFKPGGGYIPQPSQFPALLDDSGKELEGNEVEGVLVFKRPWAGMIAGFYGHMDEYKKTYFDPYPGYVCTGDVARRDEDGLYTVIGRVDDVIKTGYAHRIGTGEVESCISMHPAVAEVAAVGCPHPIMGRGLYLFVRLFPQVSAKVTPAMLEKFKKDFYGMLVKKIGELAKPSLIQWVDALPKTLSGKMMRRMLRGIADGKPKEQWGDMSGVANPEVLDVINKGRLEVTIEEDEEEDEED
eukprot:gnl/Carplike_NY0171/988_a1356_747.p1 GENE.gnl/Carplike_NY0171/988_a1356_747~~gnl/Carplike_NY0171/988_a1356_747.p1  ORF type:complete len:676 (+),score=212.91 gnl/Carplike_NY0171/988_a1356_747:114-2030(+)